MSVLKLIKVGVVLRVLLVGVVDRLKLVSIVVINLGKSRILLGSIPSLV